MLPRAQKVLQGVADIQAGATSDSSYPSSAHLMIKDGYFPRGSNPLITRLSVGHDWADSVTRRDVFGD